MDSHQSNASTSCQGLPVSTSPDARVTIIQTINKASQILEAALDSSTKWQAANYSDRASYGSITTDGYPVSLFEALQSSISAVGQQRDKMVLLVNAVKQNQTLDAVQALLAADIANANAVDSLSNEINASMTSMTQAGLPDQSTQVQAAYSMLVAANP